MTTTRVADLIEGTIVSAANIPDLATPVAITSIEPGPGPTRELRLLDLETGEELGGVVILGLDRGVQVHPTAGVRQYYTNGSGRTLTFGDGLSPTQAEPGERIWQDGPHRPDLFPPENWDRLELPVLEQEPEQESDPVHDGPLLLS